MEFLAQLVLEILGSVVLDGIVKVIGWPFRKLRELAFLSISAIDKHFAGCMRPNSA